MPAILEDETLPLTALPFPPITKSHVLNCSYHSWHPRYRAITPKSRVIQLPPPFLAYLRADGIVLPDDNDDNHNDGDDGVEWSDDSGIFSASDNPDVPDDSDDEDIDVTAGWRETHNAIKGVIAELGGTVVPKLNWSAPKDATWMNANSMECRVPNDIYLLLKSSDFITHDLEHAFDDCVDSPDSIIRQADIPHHLVLRKAVQFNPSVEFRCFVRRRRLLAICQRDLNHFDFLFDMQGKLQSVIQEFFDVRLRDSFPDQSFVFDIYVPAPHTKVWLVDINPWAPRTDPLLFSWLEILTMPDPPDVDDNDGVEEFVRLSLHSIANGAGANIPIHDNNGQSNSHDEQASNNSEEEESGHSDTEEEIWLPELRLVQRSDPEAYSFSTPQYSAHKLPKDVVDASQSGEGLREFARDWQNILAKRREEDEVADSSEGD